MKIIELRILPPVAIGRLGSSEIPLEAFDLRDRKKKPLDYRKIAPRRTFKIGADGSIDKTYKPDQIRFKDAPSIESKKGKIRPVAPFLEVFAVTDEQPDVLVPLTTRLLEKVGLSKNDLQWAVEMGNIKLYRRTGNENDKIYAHIDHITDHQAHELLGKCENFLPGKSLPLGMVQFLNPSKKHPGIRFRYTPAAGKVYGSRKVRIESAGKDPVPDPIINDDALVIYDPAKDWLGYSESPDFDPTYTNPAQIFAGYSDADGNQISWGYLDDECDGFATVILNTPDGPLTARAHISAGPPDFAPDTLPPRVVSDELEQILLGPEVEDEVPIEEAEKLVFRALETVRLMNTTIMNGNAWNGQLNVASTMVRQDTNDFGRLYEPIMAGSIVDNLALLELHERVFNGLSTGAAAWFADALRRPELIGDLSDEQRRKMPGLMRNADGRALCLTHRQINTVIKAAAYAIFQESSGEAPAPEPKSDHMVISKDDLSAQLLYRGEGNPFSVLPRVAISNCFPGLEFDFRNLWRRSLVGITLIENNNYVIATTDEFKHLLHHRLVAVDGKPTMVPTEGPVFPGGDNVPLQTAENPNGVSFMEWSNNLAHVLQKQGEDVVCHFTKEPTYHEIVVKADELDQYQAVTLRVNTFFDGDSAAISSELVQPGELTQGLCAPWQNDYRECACYYWAASRPDYVNVVPDEKGTSTGDNWMARERSGEYIPDNRTDSRLLTYDDLFANWEGELNFIIEGQDALESPHKNDQG